VVLLDELLVVNFLLFQNTEFSFLGPMSHQIFRDGTPIEVETSKKRTKLFKIVKNNLN